MSIHMLIEAGPEIVSPAIDAHSCGRDPSDIYIFAGGTYEGADVIAEHSPDSGRTWFELGRIAPGGGEIHVKHPVDWIRMRTGEFTSGTANGYIDTSA